MPLALVVDDNRESRFVLRSLLEREGYDVLCASGADDAQRQCAAAATAPAVAILDVLLPGDSGFRLAVVLRRQYPSIGLLFVSGTPLEFLARNAGRLLDRIQPFGFLEKPFACEAFHDALVETRDQDYSPAWVHGAEEAAPALQ